MIRYALLVEVRTRALLAPALAVAFVLAGVFAYKPNEPGPTWALTAFLACPLGAWVIAAGAHAEPEAAREARIAALGGHRAAVVAELRWLAAVAGTLAALLVVYPLAIGAFTPRADAGEVATAVAGHLATGAAGAALGMLAGTLRSGAAAVLVIVATLASLAAEPALGFLAGPAGVADALADARAVALTAACLACATWAAAFVALAARLRAR